MEKSQSEGIATKTNNGLNIVVHAERKRMLLAEVYVHKKRKLSVETNHGENGEQFDVFYIFEFVDDPSTKITPKLSTNCTEPTKIIDALRNQTGSDTPQLQRLIEKLSAQNEKWTEIHRNRLRNPTTAATVATATPEPIAAAAAAAKTAATIANDSIAISDGREHIRVAPLPRIRPSTVPTAQSMPLAQSISAESPIIKKEKDEDTPPKENPNASNPISNNRPKLQAVAKKSITVRPPSKDVSHRNMSNGAAQQQKPPPRAPKKQQPNQQQPRPVSCSPNANITTASVSHATAPVKKTLNVYSRIPVEKQAQSNAVQQPVKLWNNVMLQTPTEPLKIQVSVQTRKNGQMASNLMFPQIDETQKENPIENGVDDGSSTLKIGQVFEGVNEDVIDLLQMVPSSPTPPPTPQPSHAIKSVQSASPMFDTLVKEIAQDSNGMQTAFLTDGAVKLVPVVQKDDKSCADFRCNMCLTFNDSSGQYRAHMLDKHGYRVICDQCNEAFFNQQAFINHLLASDEPASTKGQILKCTKPPNANRAYICIVEPPIILQRNDKVFAFRCKNCDLAFQNQRNYVQHAQRHANRFRCKKCPTKPLNIDLMRKHLTHHKN